MKFYLGTHQPHWLALVGVPLFVSARRLRLRKSLPRAACRWALDSGGFTELSLGGQWTIRAAQYADEASRWAGEIGGLDWAAPQDWMCEPHVLAKTGLPVASHQRLTVESYLRLRGLAPQVPWVPVLQGWAEREYWDCVRLYEDVGVDLAAQPVVGLGSVCRRQDTAMAESLIRSLAAAGIRVHGFGFKLRGLRRVADVIESADSMAWSFDARRGRPLPGCPHSSCSNCLRYALRWRQKVVGRPIQRCFSWEA